MPFDHFGSIAPLYDLLSKFSSLDNLIEIAGFPTSGWLLDVGGGTGRVSSALPMPSERTIVADPSIGMLRIAVGKPGLNTAAAFSENLPFPNDCFQRVIMVDTLHHVVDQAHTSVELMRVLAPGGRLVIEEPDFRTFGVKLIAVVEKMLMMRSRFYSPREIASLFLPRVASVITKDSTAWVVVDK